MKRDSTPKTYDALARTLDTAAQRLQSKHSDMSLQDIRQRMGRDLDRFTRGNDAEGTLIYTKQEKEAMREIAIVLRLDKGRVPKATKYIRKTLRTGTHSFTDLFVKNKYVGAGSGGVAKLRNQVLDDGEDSDGSDIEEVSSPKKKRKLEKTTEKGATSPQSPSGEGIDTQE